MGIMRRNRLDLCKPVELAIYMAMQEVEKSGADIRLTKAVTLLAEAKDLVSDFIDNINLDIGNVHYYKCPECSDVWLILDKSPEWLLNQTKLGIHIRNDMKIPCRAEFIEITKEEFTLLHEKSVIKPNQIIPPK